MSMKRVKEAPIRHFYENIFYGEEPVALLLHMTPEQLMGEVRSCTPRMVQEVEAKLEKAGY